MATQSYSRPPYSPTRFPAGITNANTGENLGNLACPDPTKMQIFFEDFIAAPAALGVTTGIDGAGGLATAATTVAVDTPTASFVLSSTRRFFFKARLSLATVANTILLGFTDDLAIPTVGVTISIANNVLTLENYDGTTDTATVATVDATMYEIGFEYIPGKGVVAYLDGGVVARLPDTTFTTDPLVAGVVATGATVTLDYIFAAVERAPVA